MGAEEAADPNIEWAVGEPLNAAKSVTTFRGGDEAADLNVGERGGTGGYIPPMREP